MKKNQILATIFFSLSLLTLLFSLPMKKAENIYNSVIRIHVLANSNDALDQELKIKVRDRILDFAKENFSEEYDKDQAEKAIKEKLPEIISLSEKSLEDAGCNDSVSATLSQEYYPTREYETLSLPAGEYLSLRVMIGEAKGENWWCVLFPPVCINSAVDTEDALANAGMEKKNILTVTGKKEYVYRFKIIELFQKTKRGFQRLF